MARVTNVKKAQQRYEMVPVLNEDGTPKMTQVLRKDGTPKMTRAKAGREARPIFMAVTKADKSQPLPNRTCEKCSTEIKVGDPYKHVKPKSGPYGGRLRVRCAACPTWTFSELTSSAFLAALNDAQEAASAALDGWDRETLDDLTSALSDFAEALRDAATIRTEAADNMEEGFGHETAQSEELRSEGEAVESRADDVESEDLGEEWDEENARTQALEEHTWEDEEGNPIDQPEDYDWDEDPEGLNAEVESKREEWVDNAQSLFEDIIGDTGN